MCVCVEHVHVHTALPWLRNSLDSLICHTLGESWTRVQFTQFYPAQLTAVPGPWLSEPVSPEAPLSLSTVL